MAAFCRRVLLKNKFNALHTPCRTGYVVLLPETPQSLPDSNPLLRHETLPDFSGVNVENCEVAMSKLLQTLETGIWQLEENIGGKIEANQSINAFDEVIEPLEKIGVPMENAWGLVKALYLADQKLMPGNRYMTIHERSKRVRTNKFNSVPIYKACKTGLKDQHLSEEQRRVLNKFVLEGKLNGLDLHGAEKNKLIAIVKSMSEKRASYGKKVANATQVFKQEITDAMIVRDFPPQLLRKLAADPEQPTRGPWTVTLQPDILNSVLEHCPERRLRKELWLSNVMRCSQEVGGLNRTSVLLEEIRDLRRRQAQALGFPTYVHMSMETKMAGSLENVQNMLMNLLEKARVAQEKEIGQLEEFAIARGFEGTLEMWDIAYWKRKQQKALFNYDGEKLRNFFPLSQVLLGLFTLCEQLFDIKIEEREGAEGWHPDVRFFRIRDEKTNGMLGGFYLDPYARQNKIMIKHDPGWMVGVRSRSDILGISPLAALIFNFQEPLFGKPALLSLSEVQLLFKRFGHALQHLLTQTRYSEVSGLSNVEWDAVEVCSRFLEMWIWERGTLESVSSHFETREPLPAEILDNLRNLKRHLAGYDLCREIYLANLDLELHQSEEFWLSIVQRLWPTHFLFEYDRFDCHPCSFKEIVSEEWGAAYYCHLWSRVIAADVFSAFEEVGLENHQGLSAVGTRFRSTYLSLGGSADPAEVFKRFRGRGPSTEPLLRMLGLADSSSPPAPETDSKEIPEPVLNT